MNEPVNPMGAPTLGEVLRRMPATIVLMAACVGVAIWSDLGQSLTALRWLTFVDLPLGDAAEQSGLPGLGDGQVWRLATPVFIHFGMAHLVFNLMCLWNLAGPLEARWGSRLLLILALTIAMPANALQFVVNWDFSHGVQFGNALSGGMSGVIYGLLGYLWIRGRRDPQAGLYMNMQTLALPLAWLVLCLTGWIGYIANTGHVVGLLVGMGLGWLAPRGTEREAKG